MLFLWWGKRNELTAAQQALDLYKRQMAGQLTDKEKALEQANNNLGITQSKLMEQTDLAKAYAAENIKVNKEFEAFKKQNNLEIESYNRTIATLQEELKNQNTTTVTTNNPRTATDPRPDKQFDHPIDPQQEKLTYDWKSGDGRFELYDPDVFVASEPKTFKLNQSFRVTGEIYREKIGFLKTERLTIEEVSPDGKNPDGSVKYKTLGTAKVVDSKFNYTERSPAEWMPKDRWFGVWGILGLGYSIKDLSTQSLAVSTGVRFLQWPKVGLGLNTQLFFDTRTFSNSGWGLGIDYRPTIKDTRLNVGVGFNVYTPFNSNIGKDYFYNIGLLFYLW